MKVNKRYPTDPQLWRECINRWYLTSAGTAIGKWSSLKCALSILDYERAGGKWSSDKVE